VFLFVIFYTGSLTQLEHEEEAYEAKMRGIADVQTALPIGVTPAIMARYEKKIKELRESDNDDNSKPRVKTLVWHRRQQASVQESPQPLPATPSLASRRPPDSEHSFALSTPQSIQFHTPQRTPQSAQSMMSGNSSYNLDSSHDDRTLERDTPGSLMSTVSSPADLSR
jgi:hypothetical protein